MECGIKKMSTDKVAEGIFVTLHEVVRFEGRNYFVCEKRKVQILIGLTKKVNGKIIYVMGEQLRTSRVQLKFQKHPNWNNLLGPVNHL